MKPYKFLISGGGTGGHIYPALAIAATLQSRYPSAEFLFVGAKNRMEMQRVPEAGFPIKGLWISGIDRKLSLKNLLFPLKLIFSLLKAWQILQTFKPTLVVGTGGFASGPVLFLATQKGIPTLIQEQNSFAGITNKILGNQVDRICVAYDNMQRFFPDHKLVLTGNPIREKIMALPEKTASMHGTFDLDPSKPTCLVLGGSLGARCVNQWVEAKLEFFKNLGVQLLWQCGALYEKEYKKHEQPGVCVRAFIQEMDVAYSLADGIISRSGAGAVSELCVVGKPVLFIPSPNVAEDHQTKNAEALVHKQAALMLKESELEQHFESKVRMLFKDKNAIKSLSLNIKALARPQATQAIVNEIESLIK